MTTITVEAAEKDLAALIRRARAGEDIVISDGLEPGVRLAPMSTAISRRRFGILKGKVSATDEDLLGPLSEEEIKRWWGEGK